MTRIQLGRGKCTPGKSPPKKEAENNEAKWAEKDSLWKKGKTKVEVTAAE